MSLEDEVQRIMDMGVKATPAGVRALTEGPQYVADPVGDIVMPMLAANREAILRIAPGDGRSRDRSFTESDQREPRHGDSRQSFRQTLRGG
jgi:hypothetical protein